MALEWRVTQTEPVALERRVALEWRVTPIKLVALIEPVTIRKSVTILITLTLIHTLIALTLITEGNPNPSGSSHYKVPPAVVKQPSVTTFQITFLITKLIMT